MDIRYRSSQDREINLNTKNLKFGGGDIFKYEWKPVANERQYGTQIRQFNKEAKELEMVVYLSGSDAEKKTTLNTLVETCEYDVMKQNEGKLYFNDYYIGCFLVDVAVESNVAVGGDTPVALKFYCANPFWIKESSLLDFGVGGSVEDGLFLDYPRGYKYDYSRQMSNVSILNTNFIDTDFRMTIHGPVTNPTVYIGGHAYGVNCVLTRDDEHLVIDTIEKTIYLNDAGNLINMFDNRNRDSYIFDLIPPGENSVSWDSNFSWSIVLIEKRSEPKWT